MPRYVIDTREDADHVWGNQLSRGAEIIARQSAPDRMRQVAEPKESRRLLHEIRRLLTRPVLETLHPGIVAAGRQLLEDCDFDGMELVLPTTQFDKRYELDLDRTEST
jgi:cyclase